VLRRRNIPHNRPSPTDGACGLIRQKWVQKRKEAKVLFPNQRCAGTEVELLTLRGTIDALDQQEIGVGQ
jgi:hypothetical protein